MKKIEYYIHIPFCVRKCKYCDFLSFPVGSDIREAYVEQLCDEIRLFDRVDQYEIDTIFIGGGTPSILTIREIEKIMHTIHDYHSVHKDAEITIESNPGTLSMEKLSCYRENGINRLSMGVQSFHDEELKLLGRIHTAKEVSESFLMARKAGFDNINLDLMSALPGQKKENFLYNLQCAVDLRPEHLSAYSLIIEEGTPFYDKYYEDELKKEEGETPLYLPSEEEDRAINYLTKEFLEQHGYLQYEISNYAQPGKECRHNIGYWERKEYKGFGLGAASLIDEKRLSNTTDMKSYLSGISLVSEDPLSVQEQIEETMFLGLRMMKGVSRKDFFETYHQNIEDIYRDTIASLIQKKLLKTEEQYFRLTEQGIDLANYVMSEFLK